MINISQPIIEDEEINAVVEVLHSGMIAQGSKVTEFEKSFAKYCGTKYAIAVNNGTSAIHTALYALDIKPGDEVITVPFTFVATANPILMQGGKVVFCDISETDYCIDPEQIEAKITKKTKAILPVDLYGQIYNYEAVKQIADKHSLKIMEDAAQSIGAQQNSVRAGNFGEIAAFSLYATKNISTGEGGMITTNDESLMKRCKLFRHHGQNEGKTYEYLELGYNYRMTNIAAAMGIEQLKKIEKFMKIRNRNAELYNKGLNDLEGIIIPTISSGNTHVYHQYTIRITENAIFSRDELIGYLRENGIGSGVYYPKPLHLHHHFSKMGYKKGDFPVSEKISQQVLSLPVHPSLSENDVTSVIEKIRTLAKSKQL